MSALAASAIALARSFLFVPASRPDRYAKALASGAGAVIVDLEDAESPQDKGPARGHLAAAFAGMAPADRTRLLLRINASGTPWHDDDLALAQQLAVQGLVGIMVPKAESAAALQHVAGAVGQTCALLPLVESAARLAALDALAGSAQVLRLVFGNLDFQADLGLACDADEAELGPVRLAQRTLAGGQESA